jgi:hypothetical protein
MRRTKMTKRLTLTTLAVALVFGFTACGGNGSNGPNGPDPLPTPTQAAVTFNVDPNPVTSVAHPNDWYRFRVNLAFSESAGIGYTVDTIRLRMSVTSTGEVVGNQLFTMDMYIAANGREVVQFLSPTYRAVGGGRIGVTCDFTANITDDRGNSLTASNQVTAMHRGGPRVEIPQ